MSGPLVHTAAWQAFVELLKRERGIQVDGWTVADVMYPDINSMGASWDVATGRGDVFDKIEAASTRIASLWQLAKEIFHDEKVTRIEGRIVRELAIVCHWITDCHTLGHMSDYLHKFEYRLEPAGEFVPSKTSMGLYPSGATFKEAMIRSIKEVHSKGKNANKWTFLLSGDFRAAVRMAVAAGEAFTYYVFDKATEAVK